jgi:hypothetical protein
MLYSQDLRERIDHVQKKLPDFFGSAMLQFFEFQLHPQRSNGVM